MIPNPTALAAALVASGALDACGCGHWHDQSARCIDVAAAYRRGQAIIAADADFAERAAPLLDARESLVFHSDALSAFSFDGSPVCDRARMLRRGLSEAHELATTALEGLRELVAFRHGLWDGDDPADVPLVTVAKVVAERRELGL